MQTIDSAVLLDFPSDGNISASAQAAWRNSESFKLVMKDLSETSGGCMYAVNHETGLETVDNVVSPSDSSSVVFVGPINSDSVVTGKCGPTDATGPLQ